MSQWAAARASRVLAGLDPPWLDSQADRTLARNGWPDFVFAFHNNEEIGPRMLARIAKRTGLTPDDW